VCLQAATGWVPGNVAVLSRRAASALAEGKAAAWLRSACRFEPDTALPAPGLDLDETLRLAVLVCCATPLSHGQAARLPLRALPPPQLPPANPAQCLQTLLTLQFATPGWSERLRRLASWLPADGLRHEFNLFVGAFAPRVLAAGRNTDVLATRQALEDAWGDARVQRRWLQLALQLGEQGCSTLLQRAAAAGLAGPAPRLRAGAAYRRGAAAGTVAAATTAGRPPKNSAATSGASASCVSRPPGCSQVNVQLIMPNRSMASGV
jgi:hypothetical protein